MFELATLPNPRAGFRRAPIRSISGAALAALLLLVGCGGKATSPDGDGLADTPTVPVFAACGDGCGDGLECLEGTCTRSCSEDTECRALSAASECVQGPTIADGGGVCGVPCRRDDACASLGAGSYCNAAFCVAGNLGALPASFDELEVRRLGEPSAIPDPTPCDPAEFSSIIRVSRRLSLLTLSTCEPAPGGTGLQLDRTAYTLDEAGSARVQEAYRRLRLSDTTECAADAQAFALDIASAGEPAMLFADVEHSACPEPQLQRYSFVSGSNALYEELLELAETAPQ
jgi:hypothetical protein